MAPELKEYGTRVDEVWVTVGRSPPTPLQPLLSRPYLSPFERLPTPCAGAPAAAGKERTTLGFRNHPQTLSVTDANLPDVRCVAVFMPALAHPGAVEALFSAALGAESTGPPWPLDRQLPIVWGRSAKLRRQYPLQRLLETRGKHSRHAFCCAISRPALRLTSARIMYTAAVYPSNQ